MKRYYSKKPSLGREKDFKDIGLLEKYTKTHRRLDILFALGKVDGLTLDDIASQVGGNIKTISEHTRRLSHACLLNKAYRGRAVAHTLSPYGRRFLEFIKTFSYS